MSSLSSLLDNRRVTIGSVIEEMTMLPVDGANALCVITMPTTTPRAGVIVCPSPFELGQFQRQELELCRAAAARGHVGAYVIPPGSGTAEGEEMVGVQTRVRAARSAIDALEERGARGPWVFVGQRFGAAIACLCAQGAVGSAVALWDPILRGDAYWKATKRRARVAAVVGGRSDIDPSASLAPTGRAALLGEVATREVVDDLTATVVAGRVAESALVVASSARSFDRMVPPPSELFEDVVHHTLEVRGSRDWTRTEFARATELTVDWIDAR